jgi:competence protein ComGC
MAPSRSQRACAGVTLIELLCVIGIIMVLAGLLLGPATRVLQRVRADKWGEETSIRLASIVEQLQKHFRGKEDFPSVTLDRIDSERLVGSFERSFLHDHRVTFTPFAGSDPDEKVVIKVEVQRGYFTDPGIQSATKGDITKLPE